MRAASMLPPHMTPLATNPQRNDLAAFHSQQVAHCHLFSGVSFSHHGFTACVSSSENHLFHSGVISSVRPIARAVALKQLAHSFRPKLNTGASVP